jgi:hypothetical protein
MKKGAQCKRQSNRVHKIRGLLLKAGTALSRLRRGMHWKQQLHVASPSFVAVNTTRTVHAVGRAKRGGDLAHLLLPLLLIVANLRCSSVIGGRTDSSSVVFLLH